MSNLDKSNFKVAGMALTLILVLVGCSQQPPQPSAVTKQLYPCPGDSPALRAKNPPASKLSAEALEYYKKVRDRIDTRMEYHHAVLAFANYQADMPLFLVGVEKPRDHSAFPLATTPQEWNSGVKYFDVSRLQGVDRKTRREIKKRLSSGLGKNIHPLVPTHILAVGNEGSDSCFILNVYANGAEVPWCKHHHSEVDALNETWTIAAWTGLDRLGGEIGRTVEEKKATHLILLATGWKTEEYESFQDFLFWMNALKADFEAKGQPFRPVFVGIAWESDWKKVGHNNSSSFLNKERDADEVGFIWANYLLNDILAPVADHYGAQLVAIGHSLGGRVVLGAHYVRHALVRDKVLQDRPVTLIALEAALPIERFVTTGGEDHYFLANKGREAKVIVTASEYDAATTNVPLHHGSESFVGGGAGIDEFRRHPEKYSCGIELLPTNSTGQPLNDPRSDKVSLYDVTPFVDCQLPGTSSGSHSDVYDAQMGHFMGEIIRRTSDGE